MSDMEDELREMLHREADRVLPQARVPQRMVRRARQRVALTAVAGAVALAAIAFGGYTGVQALTSTRTLRPNGSVSPTPPAHGGPLACAAKDLALTTDLNGAAGHELGSFAFTNNADRPCTLEGRPRIELLDAHGKTLRMKTTSTAPWWQVETKPKPPGWPMVTLQPRQSARIRTSWGNWCGPGTPKAWRISIPGGGTLDVGTPPPPTCAGPSLPSTLEVGPFEPAS